MNFSASRRGRAVDTGCPERGQAAIFMTMSIVTTFGLLGLVVGIGWASWRKEACKAAAQAAAMGVTCQTPTPCPSALNTPSNPIQAACLYAQQNGFTNDPANGRQRVLVAGITSAPALPRRFCAIR